MNIRFYKVFFSGYVGAVAFICCCIVHLCTYIWGVHDVYVICVHGGLHFWLHAYIVCVRVQLYLCLPAVCIGI